MPILSLTANQAESVSVTRGFRRLLSRSLAPFKNDSSRSKLLLLLVHVKNEFTEALLGREQESPSDVARNELKEAKDIPSDIGVRNYLFCPMILLHTFWQQFSLRTDGIRSLLAVIPELCGARKSNLLYNCCPSLLMLDLQ